MIAWLSGKLAAARQDSIVLDVNGVGYLVFVSGKVLSSLPPTGAELALEIETHVREDHIHLFGFSSALEHECFLLLTSVQGVGARVALAILTVFTPDDLLLALSAQDAKALARANGVGPKLASRIANELGDKAGSIALPASAPHQSMPSGVQPSAPAGGPSADAVSALINLGYDRSDAFRAIRGVQDDLGADASLDALIKAGLKALAA
ncbi:MAG: Holliday junction branch migration protein RuvA [Pseudomonadota bacterium]